MIHEMRLNPDAFDKLRSGRTSIQLRLNDEKRKKLNAGDEILYIERETGQQFRTCIVGLHHALTFADLFKNISLQKCGFEPGATEEEAVAHMYTIYEPGEETALGVVGIELAVM